MSEVAVTRDDLDLAYRERNELAVAIAHNFEVGSWKSVDPNEPDWPVLYLELPCGQVSYHFSPRDAHLLDDIREGTRYEAWDGHSQAERSERLRKAR